MRSAIRTDGNKRLVLSKIAGRRDRLRKSALRPVLRADVRMRTSPRQLSGQVSLPRLLPSNSTTQTISVADDADDASSDDNPTILRGTYNGNQFQRNIFDQLEGYRSGRFAGIGHTLLVGGEYGRQTIDRLQYFGTAPPITLYNPVPAPGNSSRSACKRRVDGAVPVLSRFQRRMHHLCCFAER